MFSYVRAQDDHGFAVFLRDSGVGQKATETAISIEFHVGPVLAEENHVVSMQSLTRRCIKDVEAHSNIQQKLHDQLFCMMPKLGRVSLFHIDLEEFLDHLVAVKNAEAWYLTCSPSPESPKSSNR